MNAPLNYAELLATMQAADLMAAREEILLATLKTVRTLCISKMAELIIDEGLADHAKFMPEQVQA